MKCNFTPMDKFYEILDYYGLSYTELKVIIFVYFTETRSCLTISHFA